MTQKVRFRSRGGFRAQPPPLGKCGPPCPSPGVPAQTVSRSSLDCLHIASALANPTLETKCTELAATDAFCEL